MSLFVESNNNSFNEVIIWVTGSDKPTDETAILIQSGFSVIICNETQECIDYIVKNGKTQSVVGIITSMMRRARGGRKQKQYKNGLEMIIYIKNYLLSTMKTQPIFLFHSSSRSISKQYIHIGIDIIIQPSKSINTNTHIQHELIKALKHKQSIDIANKIPIWNCSRCTFKNIERKSVCTVCTFPYSLSSSAWICSECTYCNYGQFNKCKMCRYDKSHKNHNTILTCTETKEENVLDTQFLRKHSHFIKCPDICLEKKHESIDKIHIVHISDTHRKYKQFTNKIPFKKNCKNILIHTGDFSGKYKKNENGTCTLPKRLVHFSTWFRNLPHDKKIIISGNHDYAFASLTKEEITSIVFKNDKNVIYLQDEMVNIYGIRIYGTPWNHRKRMSFGASKKEMKEKWKLIPSHTDILITHQPPFSKYLNKRLCKESRGNVDLWEAIINRIKPKAHLFGHDHDYNGWKQYEGTVFINSALDWTERRIPSVAHEFDVIFK